MESRGRSVLDPPLSRRMTNGGEAASDTHPAVPRSSVGYCTLHIADRPLSRIVSKCYIFDMTTAEDIEKAVGQLGELARFRAWFEAFDAEQFDAAIERDAGTGKLDALVDEALAEHRAGRSRDL
jgi:hypothetical protein